MSREPAPHAAFAAANGKVVVVKTDENGLLTSLSMISPYVVDAHLAQAGGQILMPSEHAKLDVSVSGEQMQAKPGPRKKLRLHAGVLTEVASDNADLAAEKRQACTNIDAGAERARLRFITPGAGQLQEYQATLLDAQAVLNAGGADHPWVAAEQMALESAGQSLTLAQVAHRIVAQAHACNAALITIKQTRRTAKLAVAAAESTDQIQAVIAALRWPTA